MNEIIDNRIEEFIEAIMQIAKGNYSVQLGLSKENNLLDGLAIGINMLVDDLKHGYEAQLENEKMKILNAQLQEANKKALESDRLKTVFLQNMSHEIRTPLNAIIGFAHILPKQFENQDKLNKFSSIIEQRGRDLLELINDILDLSRIESGQLPINIEDCNLTELLNDLCAYFENHRQKIGKGHIEIQYIKDCGPKQMIIRTDKGKIKQIFVNLIYNSLKFTDMGSIRFGCKRNENSEMEFFVSDTGIGIPLEKQATVFERFVQLGNSTTNVQKGTGLGLSIVKGLIELLGGRISLNSLPGKGSTFTFWIPYEIIDIPELKNTNPAAPGNIQWNNYTILIVEDDSYNIHYIEEILSETSATVIHKENARDAIELIKSDLKIDLILMDIKLPVLDGLEATRIIKKLKPRIKIIAQTAFASNADKKNAIEAGCDGYISKPIDNDLLIDTIKEQLDFLAPHITETK